MTEDRCQCGGLVVPGGPQQVRWCEHCDVPHPAVDCSACDRLARRCDVCGTERTTPGEARACHRRHRVGVL